MVFDKQEQTINDEQEELTSQADEEIPSDEPSVDPTVATPNRNLLITFDEIEKELIEKPLLAEYLRLLQKETTSATPNGTNSPKPSRMGGPTPPASPKTDARSRSYSVAW